MLRSVTPCGAAHGRSLLVCLWVCADAWPAPVALSEHGPWLSVGNHRYEISIPVDAEPRAAYIARLKWRRPDLNPEAKGTVLLDALTEFPVAKCRRIHVSAEEGQFAFSGVPGGVYHLYYMPYQTCEYAGGTCQFGQADAAESMVQYRAFNSSCADPAWWHGAGAGAVDGAVPQARSAFDAYGPMEQIAADAEVDDLLRRAGGVLLVPQDRGVPVRMRDFLPSAWAAQPLERYRHFRGVAQPGEAYTFQVAVAADRALTVARAELVGPLVDSAGSALPGHSLRCLNLEGVDYWGRRLTSAPTVQARQVLTLWFITRIPLEAPRKVYNGTLNITTSSGSYLVALSFEIQGPALTDHGFGDLWRNARLAWLDSTLGNEDDVPPPFVPLALEGRTVTMLDKVIKISPAGLLMSVQVGAVETLEAPMRLEVLVRNASVVVPMEVTVEAVTNLTVAWSARGTSAGVSVLLSASLDATGYADFNVSVESGHAHEVRLVLPSNTTNSIYAAGLGRPGGFLRRWFSGPTPAAWSWDGVNGNSGVWVGSTRGGLRLYPKGEDPLWQAAVPYDSDRAPGRPSSWDNAGAGGIKIWPNGTVLVYTGLHAGGARTYQFSAMATPVRPLDLPKHFAERYVQVSRPMNWTRLREGGATVVNVHQGNVLNPWINYPYLTNDLLKEATDACHALGMKLKVYNTMRELSNHALELWALRALNETFVWRGGEGGGGDWLREHVRRDYSVAWATPLAPSGFWSEQIDMAIRVKALSRWNNYYVEGLRQIVADYGCDGIYLDEIAYDRVTLRRAKAVLGKDRLIDHHSDRGQFTRCPAVGYMEHFPFIDSLWYGEGFDYDDATPDHWLVEISGIPFGLNSDMLRYTGMTPFHFRGMLFASANRWQDNLGSRPGSSDAFDPRAIWALWESFGIASSTMHGWWVPEEGGGAPVMPNSTDVKCTAYTKADTALLVLANFGPAQPVTLTYNWDQLGLRPEGLHLRAPALEPMQPRARTWALGDAIDVPAPDRGSPSSREGWLILLERGGVAVVV